MGENARYVPAARCRECNALTWVVNLARGPRKLTSPEHEDGCSEPPGRLDLQEQVPLAKRLRKYGHRLECPMSDDEVEAVADEVMGDG